MCRGFSTRWTRWNGLFLCLFSHSLKKIVIFAKKVIFLSFKSSKNFRKNVVFTKIFQNFRMQSIKNVSDSSRVLSVTSFYDFYNFLAEFSSIFAVFRSKLRVFGIFLKIWGSKMWLFEKNNDFFNEWLNKHNVYHTYAYLMQKHKVRSIFMLIQSFIEKILIFAQKVTFWTSNLQKNAEYT